MTKPLTPLQQALTVVEEHQATVAGWEAEKAVAKAELTSLQRRAGEEVLADPAAGERLTREMQGLRDRVDIAARAVVAAEPRLRAAKVAAVEAEAAEWDVEAGKRRRALERHEARTAQLVAELEKHEGRYAPWEPDRDTVMGQHGPYTIQLPKSYTLHQSLQRAELRAAVLRDVAAGRDPRDRLQPLMAIRDGHVAGVPQHDLYPSTVYGATAIMPAPAFLTTLETARRAVADHDAWVASGAAERRIAEFEANRAKFAATRGRSQDELHRKDLADQLDDLDRAIAEERQRLTDAPGRRRALQAKADALTGPSWVPEGLEFQEV